VAEGEELGSNLLQVLHHRPTELGGRVRSQARPQPSPGSQGCETAILPRGLIIPYSGRTSLTGDWSRMGQEDRGAQCADG